MAQDASAEPAFGGSYSSLQPSQKRLVDDWFERFGAVVKKPVNASEGYDNLPASTKTTFGAVTHALLRTPSYDSEIDITIRGMFDGGFEFGSVCFKDDQKEARWFHVRAADELAEAIHKAAIETQQGSEYARKVFGGGEGAQRSAVLISHARPGGCC
jgi:hypothetical protein